ncbi:MAG: hypothetical protein ACRD6N_17275 [Pyrinomonadaceae bacterium]
MATEESSREVKLKSRESDATSEETLSDLEEKEKIGESSNATEDELPAPDSEPAGRRQQPDDAGPM